MNAFARLLLCTALSGLALGAQARTFEVSDFAELDNAVIEAEDGDEIVIKKVKTGLLKHQLLLYHHRTDLNP